MKLLLILLLIMVASCASTPDKPPVDTTTPCTYASYYKLRPDVQAAGIDAFAHYTANGKAEGMCRPINVNEICSYFEYYRRRPDVKAAGIDALEHFNSNGKNEGMCYPYKLSSGSIEQVWEGPADTYKLVGLLGTPYGLITTASNVYRGGYMSKVWLNHKLIYEGREETIGQPFMHNNVVYFPVEWGDHALKFDGQMKHAARTSGRWSVIGGVFNGQPFFSYNDAFIGGTFKDRPSIHHADTGAKIHTFNAFTMSRSFTVHDGVLYASGTFGDKVLMDANGGLSNSPALMIESFNGSLYGGGGMDAGPSFKADGRIYKYMNGGNWKEIHNTGSLSIQHMAVLNGSLYFAATDPDRLYKMDKNENIIKVAEILGETVNDRQRSFGAAVAYHDGYIYWGRSSMHRAYVYRIKE